MDSEYEDQLYAMFARLEIINRQLASNNRKLDRIETDLEFWKIIEKEYRTEEEQEF